jgi:murein DD-endopeptidase MepM/ murein hydrolase activator NlpD
LKVRKTLSNWLSERYLLIVRNEENFAEKSSVSFTYAKLILIIFFLVLVFLTISLFLTKSILAQWFDPRHDQIENRKHLFELTMKLDSLEEEVVRKDVYIGAFRSMLAGSFDSTGLQGGRLEGGFANPDLQNADKIAPVDSMFRLEFENDEGNIISYNNSEGSELTETYFYAPIGGYVSRQYNIPDEHFGVDVVSKENEPIKAVASGTVIMSSWTQDSGYVLAIQHADNLISVYKHNSGLLKKVGNFVLGGEVVAIIGNTGELTDGPHLHFELWYKGNPVNPEDFVSF